MNDESAEAYSRPPREGPLRQLLKGIQLDGSTGVLEIEMAGETRRFYFIDGGLHLVDGHALAQRLADLLKAGAQPSPSPEESGDEGRPSRRMSPQTRQDLRALVARIAGFLLQLETGKARFLEGPEGHPETLVGPLPTGLLVMEMAVQGVQPEAILERLGGPQARIVAGTDGASLEKHDWLEMEEVFLLSRLDVPMEVGSVLTHMGLERQVALRAIERLRALEWIRIPGRESKTPAPAPAPRPLVSPEVRNRFLERIAAVLQDRPLELDYEEHRERLGQLLSTLGEKDHYQLLELPRDAQLEKVHNRYEHLAVLVHPSHGRRLELVGGDQALELLFERATEAYLTLSDPKRRAAYDQRMGFSILDGAEDEDSESRNEELAREYFQMARRMMDGEQYHTAHELLRDAARRDPRPEYWGLLAQVQAKNPNWLRRSVESYRKAVELAPGSVELRLGLALTCEQANYSNEAKLQFESVLSRMPGHPAATAGLERLAGKKKESKPEGGGFFQRLFGRFFKS